MFDIASDQYKKIAISMNYELEAVFRRNLKFFQKEENNLYQFFKSYSPQKLQLRLSVEGYINLFNIDSGLPVYPCDPSVYAEDQVEYYLKTRPSFSLNLTLPDQGRDDYPYTKCLVSLDRLYDSVFKGLLMSKVTDVPQMFMFGGGLFLQLQHLLNKLDVKSLSIFEADHDSFYASMHLIDWSEIFRYFERDGYNLNFNIATKDQLDLVKLASIYFNKGFHHFPRVEQYFHYSNDELKNISVNFKNHLQTVLGSKGFFEDEKVGLTHTLVNLDKNISVLVNEPSAMCKNPEDYPVILVGNGPSMDESERFLLDNQNNAIVISCGSALSALINKGVTPDIHIEQERMSVTPDWIDESTTKKQRENIKLVALNPCHPRTFDLFDESYLIVKPNDLGANVMERIGLNQIEYSKYCLPLVGNTGLSVALGLGFNKIYLVGVDCGMPLHSQHHSKDSNYYENKEHHSAVIERNKHYGTFKVKGNYGGMVSTMPAYNYSRIELQALLEKYGPECYNLGDGAFIDGALSVNSNTEIKLDKIESKNDFLIELCESKFQKVTVEKKRKEKVLKDIKESFISILNATEVLFELEGLTKVEVLNRFDVLENILSALRQTNKEVYILLNGSLRGLAYKLTVARFNLNEEDFITFYKTGRVYIKVFFLEIRKNMESGFSVYDA
jgi:hypothetical protein